jgi:hypothetical protein
LTEKLSRRRYNLSREYGVDPLEMVSVADVMTRDMDPDPYWKTTDVDAPMPEVLAYLDETCRAVPEEMATTGVMSMLVVDRKTGRVCGQISAQELFAGPRRAVHRESEMHSPFRIDLRKVG